MHETPLSIFMLENELELMHIAEFFFIYIFFMQTIFDQCFVHEKIALE